MTGDKGNSSDLSYYLVHYIRKENFKKEND